MEGRLSPRIRVRNLLALVRRRRFPFSRERDEIAWVHKIGPRGLSLACEHAFPPDTRLSMSLVISETKTIRCSGIVRNLRQNGSSYLLGVEFTRLTRRDRRYLAAHLMEMIKADTLDGKTELKDRVRGLRTIMELTVSELAELTGIPGQRIVQIEFGMDKTPPDDLIERLASGLGISPEDLLGRQRGKKKGPTVKAPVSRRALS